MAKPFLKWAGGKGQLIDSITASFPHNMNHIHTYIEPFIGSGALMFHLLEEYPHLNVVINDLNADLINVYKVVKNNVDELIQQLTALQEDYSNVDDKSELFYYIRENYNQRLGVYMEPSVELASYFIFLNRTCFNGLYRVNSRNGFNVPFGKYVHPTICDETTLRRDSELLQRVTILNGDYQETIDFNTGEDTLFYFDPPYKPISKTSSFNSYGMDNFGDNEQERLKRFCDLVSARDAKFILSNSDPHSIDEDNVFFDELYREYNIQRVDAKRNINSKGEKRGKIKELLIKNF